MRCADTHANTNGARINLRRPSGIPLSLPQDEFTRRVRAFYVPVDARIHVSTVVSVTVRGTTDGERTETRDDESITGVLQCNKFRLHLVMLKRQPKRAQSHCAMMTVLPSELPCMEMSMNGV